MKTLWLLLILFVPLLNIGLNTLAQRAALLGDDFGKVFLSSTFGLAFTVGTASLLSLVLLYRTGIPLGRGILLMGAVSTVGGAIWGFWLFDKVPTSLEIVLLITIAALLSARLYQLSVS